MTLLDSGRGARFKLPAHLRHSFALYNLTPKLDSPINIALISVYSMHLLITVLNKVILFK